MRRNFIGKKVMVLILTVAMSMSVMAGCGNNNSVKFEKTENGTVLEAEDVITDEAVTSEAEVDYMEEIYDTGAYEQTNEAKQTMSSTGTTEDDCMLVEPGEKPGPNEGETYEEMDENTFVDVADEPLSTFAADVDTASYTNIRRMINDGYRLLDIPTGAVRIEEMINYFDYDIPAPKNNEPFCVTAEMNTCPWNEDNKLLMVGMRTEEIDLSDAPASNLVFLIDVSGSMYDDDKLPLLQQSFCMLAESLTENDRISIVTYAGEDTVVLEGAKGNEYKKIAEAINSLEASGGTNGSAGIQTAYELAEENFIKGGNNRVILATDGDLNVGVTTQSGLEELITEKKESGVYLSVLGFGEGNINDANMETLADKGNGNYAYIDSTFEANRVLVQQLGATLFTVAKDVKLQVEFNPEKVEGYRLIGYENRVMDAEDFDDDTKDGGEIGAGHCVVALYEIVPAGSSSSNLRYAETEEKTSVKKESKYADEYCAISIRYKEPDGDESKLLTYPVDIKADSKTPSEDFLFAAYVAETGMILKDSEYAEDISLVEIYKNLRELDVEEESRKEFVQLVGTLLETTR